MSQITVRASNRRPTTLDVGSATPRAIDLDVIVTIDGGAPIDGEVTLLPAEDGRPRFEAWRKAIDSLAHSIDYGPTFEVTVSTVPHEQLTLAE